MSQPGWYPDPGGSGQFRFWDGARWAPTTSPTPGGPTGPSGGGGGGGSGGGGQGGQRSRAGLILLLVVAIIVAGGIGLAVWHPWNRVTDITDNPPTPTVTGGGDGPITPTPSDHSTAPTPSDSPKPSEPASSGPPQTCPAGDPFDRTSTNSDGRINGGGLSVEPPTGWVIQDGGVPLGYDVAMAYTYVTISWLNQVAVGALRKDEGFPAPEAAAKYLLQCTSTASWYPDLQTVNPIKSEAVTISGHQGYEIIAEIVAPHSADIRGDVLTLVVVDTGDPEYLGMYLGTYTIGDAQIQQAEEASRATLQVG